MPIHSSPLDTPNHGQPRWSAPASFECLSSFRHYLHRVPILYAFLVTLCFCLLLSSAVTTEVEAVTDTPTVVEDSTTTSTTSSTAIPDNVASCAVESSVPSGTFDPTVDYFPIKIQLEDASLFKVTYFNSYKVVEVLNLGEQYVLYQTGTPRPISSFEYSKLPGATYPVDNRTNIIYPDWVRNATAKVLPLPLTNLALDETVAVTYFELLGARTSIRYMDAGSVTSGCVQSMALSEPPLITNFPESYLTDNASVALRAQIEAVAGAIIGSVSASSDAKEVADCGVLESTQLGRAEWLKYFGALTNREAAGNQVYDGIKSRYLTAAQAAATAANTKSKPIAIFVENDYTTQFSLASYKIHLLNDAGCNGYLPPGHNVNDAYTFANLSDFHAALIAVAPDAIVDESYFAESVSPTYEQVLANLGLNGTEGSSDWNALPFLRNKAVFRNDGLLTDNGSYDWFEGGVVLADSVLNDLIRMCQPSTLAAGYQFHWYRNVAIGEKSNTVVQGCLDDNPQLPLIAPGQAVTATQTSCPTWLTDPTQYGKTGQSQQPSGAMKINPAGMKWMSVGMAVSVIVGAIMMM